MKPSEVLQQQKLADCLKLYLKYNGRSHHLIERDMRQLGHKFNKRVLYTRRRRDKVEPGWIEHYGWRTILDDIIAAGAEALRPGSFKEWVQRVTPGYNFDQPFQQVLFEKLQGITDGSIHRLMIFLPPRHGKSELITVRYAAWRMLQDPTLNVIIGSYNQRLANRFSRKIKRVIMDDAVINAEATSENAEVRSQNSEARSQRTEFRSSTNSTNSKNSTNPKNSKNSVESDFPFAQKPINTVSEWDTRKGGGFRAVGVGSGVTGFGCNVMFIDDPIKSRAEAESSTYREKLEDWFNDDLYTRLEPNGAIILTQTRWHEDDLAGRLLRQTNEEGGEQWHVVSMPALSEPPPSAGGQLVDHLGIVEEVTTAQHPNTEDGPHNWSPAHAGGSDKQPSGSPPQIGGVAAASADGVVDACSHIQRDPLLRRPGEALWPSRFSTADLERIKRKLGSYSFAALYQQRPVPAEGGLFKRSWFRNIVAAAPPGLKWKRGYDLAINSKTTSDYTASFRVAYDNAGNLYIHGGFRKQIEYPDQRRYILGRIETELDTEHGVELSANGDAVIQELRRDPRAKGRSFYGVKVKDDKVTRALPWIALAEEGRVHLVRGAWNNDFIDECCAFPLGTNDDQIDAVSLAVRMHEQRRNRAWGIS